MLNQPSNLKLIIGSPRTGIIGETLVPDAPHEPAVPRSPTPSTKPNDLHLVYNQPGHNEEAHQRELSDAPFTTARDEKLTAHDDPDDASRRLVA
jgi:hypothetical protein